MSPAGAAGLSTNFFDYQNHDVATSTVGLVDWANNGLLTSTTTLGGTWTRAGSQGIFDGGKYNGVHEAADAADDDRDRERARGVRLPR